MQLFDECIEKINFILQRSKVSNRSTLSYYTYINEDLKVTIETFKYLKISIKEIIILLRSMFQI